MIDEIIAADAVADAVKEEAIEIKAQLEDSRVYYYWLESITDALKSGKIFEYFPIPESKE